MITINELVRKLQTIPNQNLPIRVKQSEELLDIKDIHNTEREVILYIRDKDK